MISCEDRFNNFTKMPIYNITILILWLAILLQIFFNFLGQNTFILVGLAALLASASVMKNIANTNIIEQEKVKREESEFFLETSLEEIENVYDLLKDKNNDRATWILAARVLKNALKLSKEISQSSHKKVYELQELQLKHSLIELFESKEYKNLCFFAGKNYSTTNKDSDAFSSIFYESNIISLDEDSVYTIFSFLEYPDNFEDPLEDNSYPQTSSDIKSWQKKGGGFKFKHYAARYLDVQLNENNKYDKQSYESLTF